MKLQGLSFCLVIYFLFAVLFVYLFFIPREVWSVVENQRTTAPLQPLPSNVHGENSGLLAHTTLNLNAATTLSNSTANLGKFASDISENVHQLRHLISPIFMDCWPSSLDSWGLRRFYDFFFEQHLLSTKDGIYALKETAEDIIGDRWIWADDNAKAMELFAVPGALTAYYHVAKRMYDFLMRMSPNGMIFRRMIVDRLHVVRGDVDSFNVQSGLLRITGDLLQGLFNVSQRFHDDREIVAIQLQVRVDSGGVILNPKCKLVFTGSRSRSKIDHLGHAIVLLHSSDVHSECDPQFILGRLQFRTTMYYGRSYFNHSCGFFPSENSNNTNAIRCVIGFRSKFVQYYKAMFATPAADGKLNYEVFDIPYPPHKRFTWSMFIERGAPAFSYAFGVVPSTSRSRHEMHDQGSYHELKCSDCENFVSFSTFVVAGGLYGMIKSYQYVVDHLYDDTLRFIDFSTSYDYGSEMNGVAALVASEAWQCDCKSASHFLNSRSLGWFNATLTAFEYGLIKPGFFIRGMAFTIMALDTMYGVSGDSYYFKKQLQFTNMLITRHNDVDHIDELAAMAIAFCRSALTFHIKSFALLALQLFQRLKIVPNPNQPSPCWEPLCYPPEMPFFLMLGSDSMFFTFKSGLLLRLIRLLNYLIEIHFIETDLSVQLKILQVENITLSYIRIVARKSVSHNEILTSWQSGETNSETQPWALLGMAGIDIFYITHGRGKVPNVLQDFRI